MSMIFPLHLAMTAAEFAGAEHIPAGCGWMACHFSSYGTGLSNCPDALPAGSALILNDRTPPYGHDPELIAKQLAELTEEHKITCVLLDFQRPDVRENAIIAQTVTEKLSCPVGVSALYAEPLSCPVFLPPLPHHRSLASQLQPWSGREIWLELALDREQITVTQDGSQIMPLLSPVEAGEGFAETDLHCHYHIDVTPEKAVFTLWRTPENLKSILTDAAGSGVTKAFGLYQELFPFLKEIGACD